MCSSRAAARKETNFHTPERSALPDELTRALYRAYDACPEWRAPEGALLFVSKRAKETEDTMNYSVKKKILGRLEAGLPLFTELPIPATRDQIIGLESEYGVGSRVNPSGAYEWDIDGAKLPAFWANGSCAYRDCEHVEHCTGEEVDPLRAVLSYEAGKILCWEAGFSPWLDNRSCDAYGNTFGGIHENYLRRAPRREWWRLVPFLVARTLFDGAGLVEVKGNEVRYQLSQRAEHLSAALDGDTPQKRVLISNRDEPLTGRRGYDRMHLVCGDPHMSPVNLFLTVGMTGMVGELLDFRALPDVRYNLDCAVSDMRRLSRCVYDLDCTVAGRFWQMQGLEDCGGSAVELLWRYLRLCEGHFAGRDEITDAVLVLMADTLEKLGRDPRQLCARLDWAAKLSLLRAFYEAQEGDGWREWLASHDIEYHLIGAREADGSVRSGLYAFLSAQGRMEELWSDELFLRGLHEPSPYTRALLRGRVAAAVRGEFQDAWRMDRVDGRHWQLLHVAPRRADGAGFFVGTDDPFRTYDEYLPRIRRMLAGMIAAANIN